MSDVQEVQVVQLQEAGSRGQPAWPKDALRITFGVIWLVDAVLKWLPGFRSTYMDTIMGTAQGQPAALRWWFDFWINLQHPHTMFFADLVAVVETLIALALIFGFARKYTYISAIVFSLLIWATAEGFGGPYMKGSADIGTAVIYAVVFGALLALSYYCGPSRYSVDYYLEKKVTWWWRLAEMRRPLPEELSHVMIKSAPGTAVSTIEPAIESMTVPTLVMVSAPGSEFPNADGDMAPVSSDLPGPDEPAARLDDPLRRPTQVR